MQEIGMHTECSSETSRCTSDLHLREWEDIKTDLNETSRFVKEGNLFDYMRNYQPLSKDSAL